ncbi:hypothetical protein ACR3K2_02890 [Cryptosporidium serpentis]
MSRSLYPKEFYVSTNDGVSLFCRSFGMIENGNSNLLLFVMVHPYGLMGGSSANMAGLAYRLAEDGYGSIIFDQRGVGKSTGSKSIFGNSEILDVVAVCEDIEKRDKGIRVILIGSSAGAPIAGSAVDKCRNIIAFIGIGYVFGFWPSFLFRQHYNNILNSKKPKLFIMGESDGFTSIEVLNKILEKCQEPKSKCIVPNVGHFKLESPYYDDYIAEKILDFIKTF